MAKHVEGALDASFQDKMLSLYSSDKSNTIARNALSRTSIADAIHRSSAEPGQAMTFSLSIKTLEATNQRASGRCWIFAGLNILREIVAKKLGVEKLFELSQNYISLYDKIEKANFALESVIKLAGYSPNERVFQFILDSPISDGGQWDMFVNLVKKYGLMPKACFPETFQSENTSATNFLVNSLIRQFACQAHELASQGKLSEIRPLKEKVLEDVYRLFYDAFGVPPTSFDFEYVDSKDRFHKETLTPQSFFAKYVGPEIDEYQSLINSPTKDKPFLKTFTIDYLGNVIEGKPIHHLNVDMASMKEAIIKQLQSGEPVWFGSDVSFYRDRKSHAWDDNAFDYETTFGFGIDFDKGAMLDFRHSAMNHAMVIVGVDLDGKNALKWKIENSWGEDSGKKGYFMMSGSWFDRFVYQAVVKTKYLPKKMVEAIKKEPIHLDPWDPMGTLAD